MKEHNGSMKKLCGVLGILMLLALAAACGKSTTEKWQEQYDLGQQYLLEENYEGAIVAFTEAIEIDPNQADAYIGRGNAYILSGETEEHLAQALADYQQVLELDETNAQAYLGIADIYIRQGEYDAALEILKEGQEKTGGNEEIVEKIAEIESGIYRDSASNIRRQNGYDETGALQWYHEFTYNSDGTQASVTSYDDAGNQTGHVDLKYREDGQALVSYYYGSRTPVVGCIEYEYDDKGYAVKEIWYDNTDTQEILAVDLNQYDSEGNCIRCDRYSKNGDLEMTFVSEYDDNGHLMKRSDYDEDGTLLDYLVFEYDENGDESRYSVYDADGQLIWYQIYIFDEADHCIGYEQYDEEGKLTQKVTYE